YKARCKDCLNAQNRANWAADPETNRQKQRDRVVKKQDHIRELKRTHQKAHPENMRKHSANTVRLIAKKSMPKHGNAVNKIWCIIAKLVENLAINMLRSAMPISASMEKKIAIN
ncbi:hypothetical protein JZU46_01525, partial [bacterium]|nr:hypothetical protein [bacterium]